MDGSDDYPFDDIVLDDQTLAILDQSEQKYLQERAQAAVPPVLPSEKHTNKRFKTPSGWIPGMGGGFIHQDEDDLPEISLQGDGSYGVNNRTNMLTTLPRAAPPAMQSTRPNVLSKNPGQSYQHAHQPASRVPNSHQTYPTISRQRQYVQSIPEQNQDQGFKTRNATVQNSAQLAQMVELQKKLDELRGENAKMKASLQDAIDLKMAKEGEVSILRKSIERNAQNHTTQIFQLKAEKEKADAKQAQMQKELKDEMERLRTQFTFRQQEHEASVRKHPGSHRAKKLGRDFPSTPLAVPPAMHGWNKGIEGNGFRRPIEETPLRPSRLPSIPKASPIKSRKSPEKVKNGMLPGFENAFETSTPRRSPSKIKDKGKMPMVQNSSVFGPDLTNDLRPLSQVQLSQGPSQFQLEPIRKPTQLQESFTLPDSSGPFTAQQAQLNDEDMDVALVESDEDLALEEIETIEPINWKAELCRIILTHSYDLTGETSFQKLLSSSHVVHFTNNYSTFCARILEVISNSTKSDDYDDSIKTVSISLLSLLVTLSEAQQLLSLTILFNLLTKLVISLPRFRGIIMSCRLSIPDKPALTIVEVVCTTISKYLQSTGGHPHQHVLAAETLSLLECLCFRADVESMGSLEPLVRNRDILMVLSHTAQPLWLLESTSRLLVLLSTYHNMYKILLDIPDGGMDLDNDIQVKDPLIEQLCSHLLDSSRSPSETLKICVLTYFAQLSISHPTSHGILGASYTLIPSLVMYISQLTTPLWEDDGVLASSPEDTSSLVQALNQATFLLHHLIFGIEPNLNLRHKLQHAPHRSFNSMSHIFVVTFGRLSYCEPPSWMGNQIRQELEFLAEVAREILEVVVDGPEGDSVWAAFQTEPDEESIIDEEEMEAQLMGVDA